MNRSLRPLFKHIVACHPWLHRVGTLLLVVVFALAVPRARAGLLGGLLHSQGDSGSGKVAQLAFRLDDGFGATTVVWSPDGRFLATTGVLTRTIHIWDVAQRKLFKALELPNFPPGDPHDMAWSPDGRYLAVCNSYSAALRIYATKDWSVARDFTREEALGCYKPVFSSDGQELTVWGEGLTTFATEDWHAIRQIHTVQTIQNYFPEWHRWLPKPILLFDMAYVPGTHTLVLGGSLYAKDTKMCQATPAPYDPLAGVLWVVRPGDTALSQGFQIYCRPVGAEVHQLAVYPDGKTLVTITGNTEIKANVTEAGNNTKIIRLADGKDITPALTWQTNVPWVVAYTPDGRLLIIGEAGRVHTDHAVYLVNAKTMQLLDAVHAPPDIYDLAVAPDNTGFAVATGGGVTVWRFVRH